MHDARRGADELQVVDLEQFGQGRVLGVPLSEAVNRIEKPFGGAVERGSAQQPSQIRVSLHQLTALNRAVPSIQDLPARPAPDHQPPVDGVPLPPSGVSDVAKIGSEMQCGHSFVSVSMATGPIMSAAT